jgi:hypothetical protein
MGMYFVKSWPIPKRMGGTYPKGYLSAQVDGRDHGAAVINFLTDFVSHRAGETRYIEVEGAWSGERKMYTLLPDGTLKPKSRFG